MVEESTVAAGFNAGIGMNSSPKEEEADGGVLRFWDNCLLPVDHYRCYITEKLGRGGWGVYLINTAP